MNQLNNKGYSFKFQITILSNHNYCFGICVTFTDWLYIVHYTHSIENVLESLCICRFIEDIWGCTELIEKVFMVVRTPHHLPQLLMFDRLGQRVKVTAEPPAFLSGLMCQVALPAEMLSRMTESAM